MMLFACCAAEDPGPALVIPAAVEEHHPVLRPQHTKQVEEEEQQQRQQEKVTQVRTSPLTMTAASGDDGGYKVRQFTASLSRSKVSSIFGWQLDPLDPEVLYINALNQDESTAVQVYNASVDDDLKICVGDYIVGANGIIRNSTALQNMVKSSTTLELLIQRPKVFNVNLYTKGKAPGLTLKYASNGNNLVVASVGEGAVKESGIDIVAWDRIIAVCGTHGQPKVLVDAIHSNDPMELTISRLTQVGAV